MCYFHLMKRSLHYLIIIFSISFILFACRSKKPVETTSINQEQTPPPPPNADSEITNVVSQEDSLFSVLLSRLNSLEGVTAKKIKPQNGFYRQMAELQVDQPIDHFNTSSETFTQKVYLSHLSFEKPMVMYLNGYTAGNNAYVTEPAEILEANQIHVEHRFFSDSRPDSIPWNLLTIEQSAYDHHRIVELLKPIYDKPWVSTGISKGGMVTMFHKKFFPSDVAVAMPYVAPLNLERHDQRIYDHLNSVGTAECRDKITEYQRSLLINRDSAMTLFKKYSSKAGYTFPLGYEASFELSVFEFSFAFWQWSGDCNAIPEPETDITTKMKHLFYTVDAPSFFNEKTLTGTLPFFYQGYYEIGMYGYEVDKFSDLTKVYKNEVDNYYTFIPSELDVTYDPEPLNEVKNWLDKNCENMIFVYGELDPWGATAYEPKSNSNSLFLMLDQGNHSTRLKNFPRNTRAQAMDSLKKWVEIGN